MKIKALYTVREVADLMGETTAHVRHLVETGQLDAVRLPGKKQPRYRIPLASLQALASVWHSIQLRSAYGETE